MLIKFPPQAFDNEQLIELILKMVAEKPELLARVLENLPKPDLAKTLKRLDQLERNVSHATSSKWCISR